MEQLIMGAGQDGFNMSIDKLDMQYLINIQLKALNGKVSAIGTEEDFGESLEDLRAKIQALTNLLEML